MKEPCQHCGVANTVWYAFYELSGKHLVAESLDWMILLWMAFVTICSSDWLLWGYVKTAHTDTISPPRS
jgi:hypothetical protein